MNKKQQLEELRAKMEADKSLSLRDQATQLVFGIGDPDAKIYFLGEAPGYFEDKQGEPFVGQAGKLLDKLLEDINLKREDVYISNVVRFRPPQNRDPLPQELAAFAQYVDQEIAIINPKVIITLGRFSMGKFLPNARISQVHGKVFRVPYQGKKVIVVPMYHPAAALRNGAIMDQLQANFKIIPQALKVTP